MSFLSKSAKVLTASLVLASVTSLAFAKGYKGENYKGEAPCPPPVMLKDGWYLGAQVGYDSYRDRQNNSVGVFGSSANPVYNATGWLGGLYLGYGQYLTPMWYLGGEVFGNVSDAQNSTTFTSGVTGANVTTKFNVNGNYGLALVPGMRLNDTTLGYLKLGWNWASVQGKISSSFPFSYSKSSSINGFDLGFGMETLIVDNWSVRGEYNHTWFGSTTVSGTAGGVPVSTKFNVSDNQVTFGVSYHFA